MVAFVRNLGTASSTSTTATTLAITIPAAGAAAGDLVVVRFGGYNYTSGTVTCADSKGNTYQTDWSDNSASDGLNVVFSSILTTALVSGNTITVTFPAGNQQYALTADEFSGIANSGWAWQVGTKATGTSTTPSDSITPGASPPASTLVLGILYASLGPSDTFTEDTTHTAGGDSWHSLTAAIATSGANQEGTRAAYKIPTSGNTGVAQTWAPTLGTSHFWVENLIIYKGSTGTSYTGTGTAALTLGSSGVGTPKPVSTGSAAVTLGSSGSGTPKPIGTGTAALPAFGSSAAAVPRVTGTGTVALTLGVTTATGIPPDSGLAPSGIPISPPKLSGPPSPALRYRLCLANAITGQIVADLPIGAQKPAWARQILTSGSLSATIPLQPRLDPDVREMLREPWRWMLVYAYGNAVLQAGFLEAPSFDDTVRPYSATLTTCTMWDWLSKKRLVFHSGLQLTDPNASINFSATSTDLANRNLSWASVAVRLVQITIGNALSLYTPPIVLPQQLTTGTAQITYLATDLAYIGQRITEITQQDQGPEIEFSPEWVDDKHDRIQFRMRITQPRLGRLDYPWAYDYRRAMQSLKVTIDGSNQTYGVFVKGQDNRFTAGGLLTWATAADYTAIGAGWPWMETANTDHVSEVQAGVVQAYANLYVNTHKVPAFVGAATVRADGRLMDGQLTGSPPIDVLQVGDTCKVQVVDHPILDDGLYGARIVSMGNGSDWSTAVLGLQILGVAT